MSKFGTVVAGSLVRGKIKNHSSRKWAPVFKSHELCTYFAVPILSNSLTIGEFLIRLFADNNRTKCKWCGETSHPYYRCTNKALLMDSGNTVIQNTYPKTCWDCSWTDHVRSAYPRGIVCHACGQKGHTKLDCPVLQTKTITIIRKGISSRNQIHPRNRKLTQIMENKCLRKRAKSDLLLLTQLQHVQLDLKY